MTDLPDRPTPRFPETEVARVCQEVERLFMDWAIGADDLLICGGARGGDLICATVALRLGSTVWTLLAQPPDQFVDASVAGTDPAWIDEFWKLLQRSPSWQLDQCAELASRDDIHAATNEWMLAVASLQAGAPKPRVADHDDKPRTNGHAKAKLVAVWDGTNEGGLGGAADMVANARSLGVEVVVIDPRPASS
jgi:hypothetical protein